MLGAFIAISVHHSDIVGARKMVSRLLCYGCATIRLKTHLMFVNDSRSHSPLSQSKLHNCYLLRKNLGTQKIAKVMLVYRSILNQITMDILATLNLNLSNDPSIIWTQS